MGSLAEADGALADPLRLEQRRPVDVFWRGRRIGAARTLSSHSSCSGRGVHENGCEHVRRAAYLWLNGPTSRGGGITAGVPPNSAGLPAPPPIWQARES